MKTSVELLLLIHCFPPKTLPLFAPQPTKGWEVVFLPLLHLSGPSLAFLFFYFCNLFAALTQCRHQCTCLWVVQSFCVLFRAGDIFSSVKVLYFFNNSWIGGIKLMFHAWGVKDEREERSKLERNKKE